MLNLLKQKINTKKAELTESNFLYAIILNNPDANPTMSFTRVQKVTQAVAASPYTVLYDKKYMSPRKCLYEIL